jgi:hypothetical protein
VDAGRIVEELTLPLKLVLERLQYQPEIIALEDTVAEDASSDED